jgi:peptidoglycan/LPS O-acetylase OafA/YrhL
MPVLSKIRSFLTGPGGRFEGRSTFIDALRGIAALSVTCYHIFRYGPFPEPAAEIIPEFLQTWFDHGWIGVQVFFVISGFVIAYSLRGSWITPGFTVNYAFRRSLRLDPPYWTTITIVLLLHWLMHLHLGFESPLDIPTPMDPPFSWHVVVSHLLYLQGLMGYENLSAGFWTLCIEVQFYLMYVVGQGVAQRLGSGNRPDRTTPVSWALPAVFAPIAVLSLFVWNPGLGETTWKDLVSPLGWSWLSRSDPGRDFWITHFFCMFFLGCAAWWALDGRVSPRVFWGYVLLFIVRLAWLWSLDLTIALVAGVSIYLLGRMGRLTTALSWRPLQYLGRISYSLYLIHFSVAYVVTSLGYGYLTSPEDISPVYATVWLCLALVASLGAAHLLYRAVESPSVRLAARFRRAEPPRQTPRAA